MNTTLGDVSAVLTNILPYPYNSNYNPDDDSPGFNFAHKLRDMEEFTATAQHFNEFGVYTRYPPNRHPKSKFMQFWKEEKRRAWEGYNIGRDWIPGYYYWYLNYQRLQKVFYTDEALKRIQAGETVAGRREESFPDPWDYDYYSFHYLEEAQRSGQHGSILKSRGKGWSYKGASMVNRNYFLGPNGTKSYVIADESGYLDGPDGILSRAFESKEFINKNTPFFRYSQKRNKAINYRASKVVYTADGREFESGSMNEVIGISLKGNPGRIRGKRGMLYLWEESGNFPDLLEGWLIAKESISQDNVVFGLMVAFGTSGSDARSFRNLREFFTNPKSYGIYGINNIWSLKASNKRVSFFVPSYSNINGFTDKDGNTDIVAAYASEESRLEFMRLNHAEPSAITQTKMERPKHPEDALQRKSSNAFPVAMLRDRLAELETNESIMGSHYIGRMVINQEGEVDFVETPSAIAITDFPHNVNGNNEGAVVMFRKPARKKDGKPFPNVNIAGGDPYDHDKSTTMSLGSTFIMSKVTGELLAEYTGRPDKADDYWEQVRLLLLYYDARINHENALIGFRNHLISKGCEYLMVDTPSVVKSLSSDKAIDREKGTPATTKINNHARTLISIWLKDKVREDGEKLYLHTIESKALIQELIDWDPDGNYDRVSALGMLLILLEDTQGETTSYSSDEDKTSAEYDEAWNDIMFGDKVEEMEDDDFEDF